MPISINEKLSIDEALASFTGLDSVQVARLLYLTLLDARISKENPNGLGWKAISSLGRLVKDKAPWEAIQHVEKALFEQIKENVPIRMPFIKSTDTIFRTRFATVHPQISEENKQLLAYVLGKMDANELLSLSKLLYEVLVQSKFENDAFDAFLKLYFSGFSWEEISRDQGVFKGVFYPIADSCHNFFRETFSNIFAIEEPQADSTPVTPEAATAEPIATAATTPAESPVDTPILLPPVEVVGAESSKSQHEPMLLPSGDEAASPEFATPEEVEARAKKDEEKPKFRGKKQKSTNGESQVQSAPATPADSTAEIKANGEPPSSQAAEPETPLAVPAPVTTVSEPPAADKESLS